MSRLTQAAFAKQQGWNKGTVTRLKQAGRLIMQGGLVEVEASLKRIEETGGMRFDVAARHAQARTEKHTGATASNEPAAHSRGGSETRASAQARKEAAAADLLEMEREEKRRNLIPREVVDLALKSFAASARAKLDVLADQLAPVVAPVSDLNEIHALLSEQFRQVLASIAEDMLAQERALVEQQ